MDCVELQENLGEMEGSAELRAHVKDCADCAALVAELSLIASAAAELSEASEPSPRVWNSIEIALRQEGLIRPQRAERPGVPSFIVRWGWARWMVPAAAALLIALGVYMNQHSMVTQLAKDTQKVAAPDPDVASAGFNDADLLQEVSNQTPFMKAQYADNLRRVNEYILDAKSNADLNPNDEEARRSLMEAYQQKALLFEMAMDRSGQ